ncbi:hypothetical protein Nepgr_001856 [Nepenthes gracilis]|uniref:THUMP domain-containing protein n=1 Tax=Nepenthes gracilis TaxID=150966 RepID=A0AAD3RWC9_NEPGR|nr:hypothetical protein Nepgr_001856 [Nepenthes gracilis]
MATEIQRDAAAGNDRRKRKQRYLPHNKPSKKKGSTPLKPGMQGFFITCDGGKERQAFHEAINIIDSFFEELIHGKDVNDRMATVPNKLSNKKIKFKYSDSSDSEGDDEDDDKVNRSECLENGDANNGCPGNGKPELPEDDWNHGSQGKETSGDNKEDDIHDRKKTEEISAPPAKRQCRGTNKLGSGNSSHDKTEMSIDKLIDAELEELGDKSKRRFTKLDSGCNGVVLIQMQKRDGEPGPKEIVQLMMESAASTRRQMSRFMLRVLPVEITCYASAEEISRAINPTVARYFPVEAETPVKFAVLYDARANTGIDRMKIIDAVARSVPGPHKVDLKDPAKTIVVQIVKTMCLIGVVDKYKELAKYNLRQLTSPKS